MLRSEPSGSLPDSSGSLALGIKPKRNLPFITAFQGPINRKNIGAGPKLLVTEL